MADLSKLPQPGPGCEPAGLDPQAKDAYVARFGTAWQEACPAGSVSHPVNTDETGFADKSGTYTKCLKQKDFGIVDPAAFTLFRQALGAVPDGAGGTANFEVAGLLGGTRKLNGPLGSFALTLNGADSQCFGDPVVPAAFSVTSKEYAVELVELYWASLLRDVPFSQYETNATVAAAAQELTSLKTWYKGPLEGGKVTPKLLFRGGFKDPTKTFFDEQHGPYISQFAIYPTSLGSQPIDQKIRTYTGGVDFMTTLADWQMVQSGIQPLPHSLTLDPVRRYLYNGRALASYTHVDELYQAYLVAYLVMETLKVPPNPHNPYMTLKNQQPFGTFGGPDIAATLGAVARAAINAVWYQKWIVHLRHRPESGGGLVELQLNPPGGSTPPMAKVDSIALNSTAVKLSRLLYGSYLLSQAFPEGSPAHPAYPTGHGTVAGACITVLKFFFNGDAKYDFAPVLQPSADGLALDPYPLADAGQMTVNGELHKLAHNISFGHGIHAGIHWRSDTDYSLLLGEAVALKFLQDQAWTYKEKVDVKLRKMDGSMATIKNF
jgi:hypothetical protein